MIRTIEEAHAYLQQQEPRRAETEARYWLRHTKGEKSAVSSLIQRIATKRGQEAADRLRADMRRLYREEIVGDASRGKER